MCLSWFLQMDDLGLSSFSSSVVSSGLLFLSSMSCFVSLSKLLVSSWSKFFFYFFILHLNLSTWIRTSCPFFFLVDILYTFCNGNFAFSIFNSSSFVFLTFSFSWNWHVYGECRSLRFNWYSFLDWTLPPTPVASG